MTRFDFVKMEGLGNDYVYVDLFEQREFAATLAKQPAALKRLAQRVSDRHFGVGADGLILVGPGERAPFRMTMFNADGSESAMCGNGLRCVAKLVADRGYVEGGTADVFEVESGAGVHRVEIASRSDGSGEAAGNVEQVRLAMGAPRLRNREVPTTGPAEARSLEHELLLPGGERVTVSCVSMGNPHAVIFLPPGTDVREHPVTQLGPLVERHPYFPERTNVEFVEVRSETRLIQRTWERGSGETLACGSGACAVLVAAHLTGRAAREATVTLLGGDLRIAWDEASNTVYKTGPATNVFTGTYVHHDE